ncbi:MAG: hypothetical protein QOD93_781 [Acetobacteraceae bacterium]|jgi:DNA-binding MarR family transcriptional regulator|nr:MarR family transcriptional regulator [Rhodopila sp.]MEA2731172.1 hypothetical protein [Acetobacteraceae bacterium]MEA2767819.1 hypothetical protein [Acetobacteraceae bacterium]
MSDRDKGQTRVTSAIRERSKVTRKKDAPAPTEPLKLELDNYIPGILVWLTNRLVSGASQTYRKRFGIGTSDWRVLSYLGVYGIGTAAQICALIDMNKAAASRSASLLERSGYVKSEPRIGRRLELRLTPKGRDLYEQILGVALARERVLLEGISEDERVTFIRLVHHMLANLPKANKVG